MSGERNLKDYLYGFFLLFCALLVVIGYNMESSDIANGIIGGGAIGAMVFVYLHRLLEREYIAYIITLAIMIFAVIAISLDNHTLMAIALIGSLLLCAIVWIFCKIKYGEHLYRKRYRR